MCCQPCPARPLLPRLRHAVRGRPSLRWMPASAFPLHTGIRRARLRRRTDPSSLAFQTRRTPPSGSTTGRPASAGFRGRGRAGGRASLPGSASSSTFAPARLQPGARTTAGARIWGAARPACPRPARCAVADRGYPNARAPIARPPQPDRGPGLRRQTATRGRRQACPCRRRRHDHRGHTCRMRADPLGRWRRSGHGRLPGARFVVSGSAWGAAELGSARTVAGRNGNPFRVSI